ncbi:MAG TPA: hypothetical protein VK458_17390 [Myxococcaceae bacterium]|nr:hypothetical protein [Myxococcaceae bacterium]
MPDTQEPRVIRFRKLTSREDWSLDRPLPGETPYVDLMDYVGKKQKESPARKVTAHEGSGSFAQVRVLLLSGELQLTDLVDAGQGWQTFEDCLLFDAERTLLLRRASRRRAVLVAGGVLGVVLLVMLLRRC